MPTLLQLAQRFQRLLVLDAAATSVQVGWWCGTGDAQWSAQAGEAGVALFRALERLGGSPRDAGAFVYCDGPGSILGIRTVAMAIRTWCVEQPRPVFAFHSLSALAHAAGNPEVTYVADARRGLWHRASSRAVLTRVPERELSPPLATPENFRTWAPLPPGTESVPYALPTLFPRLIDKDVFRPTAEPDAFLHEEPAYAKWTPQIHRAP